LRQRPQYLGQAALFASEIFHPQGLQRDRVRRRFDPAQSLVLERLQSVFERFHGFAEKTRSSGGSG